MGSLRDRVFFPVESGCTVPVALAPMTGVTDGPFRDIVRSLGGGYLVSEMIVSRDSVAFAKSSPRKIVGNSDAIQLAGNDPYLMAEAARLSVDMGAKAIDINFGCPAKKVVNSYCGAFLMRDEVLARSIIASVVDSVDVPVTVKMRLGWDEENKNAVAIARIAEDSGIAMLSVHGRTRAQMYTGSADWKAVGAVKSKVNIPVLVNGDIVSYDDAKSALELSGADGIMVGRACYGRPWFIRNMIEFFSSGRRSEDPSILERKTIMMQHLDLIFAAYGNEVGLGYAKKHAAWYSKGLDGSAVFRASLATIEDARSLIGAADNFFQ